MSSSPPPCPEVRGSSGCWAGGETVGMLGIVGKATGIGGGRGDGVGEEVLAGTVGAISTGILSSERIFFRSKSFPLGSSPTIERKNS